MRYLITASAVALGVSQPVCAQDDPIQSRIDMLTYYQLYSTCIRLRSTVDGAFNHTDAKTVVLAARPKCSEAWNYFEKSLFGESVPTQSQKETLEIFRGNAEGEAAEAVIAMRAGSCGTQSRKLRC